VAPRVLVADGGATLGDRGGETSDLRGCADLQCTMGGPPVALRSPVPARARGHAAEAVLRRKVLHFLSSGGRPKGENSGGAGSLGPGAGPASQQSSALARCALEVRGGTTIGRPP